MIESSSMSREEPGDLPPVELGEEDMEELKKVIIEFLSRYEGLYEKRIQKLVFYSEVVTATKTGQRLTDATFTPYKYGPYSQAVRDALNQLAADEKARVREDGQYVTDLDSTDLSPKKKYLIAKIHEETKRMSTEELVDRAKDTWLWKEFEHAEEMDFARYIDEVVMPPEERLALDQPERNPVDDPDLESLLT